MAWLGESNYFEVNAYKMTTADTIQVYGLAGGYSSMIRDNPQYFIDHGLIEDTSHANAYIYMRLYEADDDSLRYLGEEQMVHLNHTPVSYYLDLGLAKTSPPDEMYPPIPMYERYFSAPITVADSFYVGNRYRSGQQASLMAIG
ncbi:MAG: hypothetical protein K6F72_05210 [Bacteroidales bacterium]|nr:hypothetical protein [Bacteroidales bacterium]